MKKIEKLTPEQIAKFPEYVKRWTDIGICTEPANREDAEKAIAIMYESAGLKKPKIVWCGSPFSNALTRVITKEIFGNKKNRGFGLGFGQGSGRGFGLGFGLGFGRGFGLGFGRGFGQGFGQGFGLGFGLWST